MTRTCSRLGAGEQWPTAPAGSVFSMRAPRFEVAISVHAENDHPPKVGRLGEEVGAILEGDFRVDAAGETYELTAGEAILIPPDEMRTWTCQSKRGVLYRVILIDPDTSGSA